MLQDIYNFRLISPDLATAGQPDIDELHEIANSGFEAVINLGLAAAEYAIASEKAILNAYNIDYYHLPVSFSQPEIETYGQFSALMKNLGYKKTFIHCAANKRVSVFLALFRIIEQDWSYAQAYKDIELIWQPDDVWKQFIKTILIEHNCI